jgi:hypothetical protein
MERHFDEDLRQLKERLLRMGSIAEEMIQKAVKALHERRDALTEEVFDLETQVNQMHIEIDDRCLKTDRAPSTHGRGPAPDRRRHENQHGFGTHRRPSRQREPNLPLPSVKRNAGPRSGAAHPHGRDQPKDAPGQFGRFRPPRCGTGQKCVGPRRRGRPAQSPRPHPPH